MLDNYAEHALTATAAALSTRWWPVLAICAPLAFLSLLPPKQRSRMDREKCFVNHSAHVGLQLKTLDPGAISLQDLPSLMADTLDIEVLYLSASVFSGSLLARIARAFSRSSLFANFERATFRAAATFFCELPLPAARRYCP